MRVLIKETITYDTGKVLTPGRLVRCTKEKALELLQKHGDKVYIWWSWPSPDPDAVFAEYSEAPANVPILPEPIKIKRKPKKEKL